MSLAAPTQLASSTAMPCWNAGPHPAEALRHPLVGLAGDMNACGSQATSCAYDGIRSRQDVSVGTTEVIAAFCWSRSTAW